MRLSSRLSLKSLESILPAPVQLGPSPPPTPKLSSTLVSRRVRYRGAYLLLLLLSLSAYFCLIHPSFSSRLAMRGSRPLPPDPLTVALDSIRAQMVHGQRRPHPPGSMGASPLVLDAPQELAAVSSFLASLRSNSIPHFVDPSQPIDPELVLEFDTRSPRAPEEVQVMVEEVWTRNPVFLYAKRASAASREVKAYLNELHLAPAPTVIDMDTRADADVLAPLLMRLTGAETFPIMLVGGEPIVRDMDEFRALRDSGELKTRITQAGAIAGAAPRRKKH
ncbi:hypothetical protein BD626DRAFT_390803 [Schizophyllum amplum]|uniref:Uncharacterized protein n=1 Tax=Schizophyllum amplum TaxID=97359 RepID=A0A550CZP8_9AGAR|nr:hypothetical protein BD626DRAFT_390803 [Auriculariopsis ampla]